MSRREIERRKIIFIQLWQILFESTLEIIIGLNLAISDVCNNGGRKDEDEEIFEISNKIEKNNTPSLVRNDIIDNNDK